MQGLEIRLDSTGSLVILKFKDHNGKPVSVVLTPEEARDTCAQLTKFIKQNVKKKKEVANGRD